VVQADGGTARLSAVETTPIRGPPVLVYNLEVEGSHTYFVGREGVWVHNCNAGIRRLNIPRSGRLIGETARKRGEKLHYLFNNRNDAMNWAAQKLGHNKRGALGSGLDI
jgi:hypothetical protein